MILIPANADFEFGRAQEKYLAAKTLDEKIAALQEMISRAPKHKGSENLLRNLKTRLANLKKEKMIVKKRKAARHSIAVKKEGFQIAIIGFPNAGKSSLLKKLTNANPKIAPYAFTTVQPEVGMMDYEGGRVQLVEVPALIEGAAEKQKELLSLILAADGLILLADDDYQRNVVVSELRKADIQKPTFFASKNAEVSPARLFEFFQLIRVYTKEPGKEPETKKPVILKRGATVLDVAKEIHKDFAANLKFARVWGSSRFRGQRVEQDYVLADKDVVELRI